MSHASVVLGGIFQVVFIGHCLRILSCSRVLLVYWQVLRVNIHTRIFCQIHDPVDLVVDDCWDKRHTWAFESVIFAQLECK